MKKQMYLFGEMQSNGKCMVFLPQKLFEKMEFIRI